MRYPISLALAAIVIVSACTNFQEEEVPVSFGVNLSELSYDTASSLRPVVVSSGTKWTVASMPAWMSLQSINPSGRSPYEWTANFMAEANDGYNREGRIVINAKGESAEIALTQDGKKGKYVAVESVSISPSTLTLTEGESSTLTYTISPSNASEKGVTWKSSSPSVATVSESGEVEALAVGTTTITITTEDGGKTSSCAATVKAKVIPVESVSLDKTSITLTVGDIQTLTATINPENATDKTLIWSSSNTSVARVSISGEITAIAAGTATITVSTSNGATTATCGVTVNERPLVTSISVDGMSISDFVGGSYSRTPEIVPSNARYDLEWTVSNPRVVEIQGNGRSVVVHTKDYGMSTVTVSDKLTGISASFDVTTLVSDFKWKENTGSTYSGYPLITIEEGDEYQLHYSCVPSTATHLFEDLSEIVFYENGRVADAPSFISIDENGLIKGLKAGTTGIKPTGRIVCDTSSGQQQRVYITVKSKAIPVSGIVLDKTTLTMAEGDSQTLTATVSPYNATDKSVEWSSNKPSVATVSSSGVVTAKSAGTATITVRTNDGGKTATCSVSVSVPVTGVSLDKTSLTMAVGDMQTLTATVTPSTATDKSVTWSSSNTSVATVSSSGVITAKAAGITTITVTTNDGRKNATCSVTVTPVAVTGVTLNKSSLSLYQNDSETLVATVLPSNASNKNVSWSTSNSSVATVTTNGQVTAISSGTATITVTTTDGGKTASCVVSVTADPYGAVDLGLSVKWSSFNYGASSITATGGYYFYGDPTGNAVIYSFTPPNVNSISGTQYDIVRRNWGGNWRIPTRAEINELYSLCTWTSTTLNGVSVLKVTGPSGACIYLPFTGCAFPADGPIGTTQIYDGNNTYLMSDNSYSDSNGRFVYVYYFTSSGQRNLVSYRADFIKFPIRPVR